MDAYTSDKYPFVLAPLIADLKAAPLSGNVDIPSSPTITRSLPSLVPSLVATEVSIIKTWVVFNSSVMLKVSPFTGVPVILNCCTAAPAVNWLSMVVFPAGPAVRWIRVRVVPLRLT